MVNIAKECLLDSALNVMTALSEGAEGRTGCECDVDYLCLKHQAERWLEEYDKLAPVVVEEANDAR